MQNLISENKLVRETIVKNLENTNLSIKKLEKDCNDKCYILEDKIRALQNEKYKLQNELLSNKKLLNEAVQNHIEENKCVTEKYNRTIQLILLSKNVELNRTPKLGEANNRGKFVELIDTPIKNKYFHVGVYVFMNDNRTNNFTLGIVYTSIFNHEVLRLTYDYGFKPYFVGGDRTYFESVIKNGKSKKELIEYYNKKGLDKLIETNKMNEIVSEYENVINNCNTKEWNLEVLLWQKNDYEKNWSNGTEKEEYKKVLEDIKLLGC